MSDEVQQPQDRTPDSQPQPPQNSDVNVQAWESMPSVTPQTTPDATQTQTDLTFGSAFRNGTGTDEVNGLLPSVHGANRAELGNERGQENRGGSCSVSPDKAKPCATAKDQQGIQPGIVTDVKADQRTAQTSLRELAGGNELERITTSKNKDGSTTTVKNREEYVRDKSGAIKLNEDGSRQTRILEQEKESRTDGKVTFRLETKNKYNANGDLEHSNTDTFVGDSKTPKNSFVTNNRYDEKGNLDRHESKMLNANGETMQSTEAQYGYDEHGNRTSEEITRVKGNNKHSYENRQHQYQKFGDKFERVHTTAQLLDANKSEIGKLDTLIQRHANGKPSSEHTVEYDKDGREVHRFDAKFDKNGLREHSTDVHKTWHQNGTQASETVSEFNANSDSTATRTRMDEKGNVTSKTGFVQKMDGSFVSLPDAEGNQKPLLSADAGGELGGAWYGGDRESSWNQLERLSGDATNRDAVEGFDNLGRFGGGPGGNQEAGVWKLSKWGQGDAVRGVDILEEQFGNGDGRAAQGVNTYLSIGTGAAFKEATSIGGAAMSDVSAAATNLIGFEFKKALDKVTSGLTKMADAVTAMSKVAQHSERLLEEINPEADKAGAALTFRGGGCCSNGVCEIKKDGDQGVRTEVPGEPDAMERGINSHKAWSTSGDFIEGLRVGNDIANGDILQLGPIREQMGSVESLAPNGEVVTSVSRLEGNANMLRLGTTEDGSINPEQAREQFKRAGVTPEGYEPMVAARNFFEGGVTTQIAQRQVIGSDGKPAVDAEGRPVMEPVLDAEGKPVVHYLRSAERGVEAVVAVGNGSPVHGMDAMTELSTRRDANNETVSVDMRVGFEQLPKIGEQLQVVNGHVVAVRDSVALSAPAILAYGAPALDAQGNPVPQYDAQGRELPKGMVMGANGTPVPQGVAGAQALVEVTRTANGTDGSQIYTSLQAATAPERAIFEASVAKAAAEGTPLERTTFSAADTTREALQFISRTPEQSAGTALEGAQILTREQTAADGRTFTVSPDGSAVGALNAIRQADSAPAGQQTMIGGAREVARFSAATEQTFVAGAAQTAAMADRTVATPGQAGTGEATPPNQLFTQGVQNVQAYSKSGTFADGRATIEHIGGGSSNPEAIPQGVREVRTAADRTTAGSVSQLAQATAAAGGGDPRVGADAMMNYNGRESSAQGSYSAGATALYKDLYGSPTAPRNAAQTLQPADVQRAVNIATPGTAPAQQLQSGMDKTNALVASSTHPEITGAQVLNNLHHPANAPALEAVRRAPDAVAAREALVQQGTLAQITTPTAVIANANPLTANTTTTATKDALAPVVQPKEQVVASERVVQTNITYAAPMNVERSVAAPSVSQPAAAINNTSERQIAEVRASNDESPVARAASGAVTPQTPKQQEAALQQIFRSVGSDQSIMAKVSAEKAAAVVAGTDKLSTDKVLAAAQALQPAVALTTQQIKQQAAEKVEAARIQLAQAAQATQATQAAATRVEATRVVAQAEKAEAARIVAQAAAASIQARTAGGSEAVAHRLQGNVSINIGSGVSFAKQASGTGQVEGVRTARQGEVVSNTLKQGSVVSSIRSAGSDSAAAAAAAAAGRTPGRVVAGAVGPTGSANSPRSNDVVSNIGRTFRGVGYTAAVDTGRGAFSTKLNGRKFRRLTEGDRALLGAEIALAALLVSASVAKQRAEQKKLEIRKKQKLSPEFARLSDRLDEVGEIVQDDNMNQAQSYKPMIRPTWLVRHHEDLVKLAEHLFHEAELGWLIADLNIGQTKESYIDGKRIVELRTRQRIDLPVWQDIVEFHKSRNTVKPENLITIVTEAEVDKELMNATLGLAMGAAPALKPATVGVGSAVPITAAASVAVTSLTIAGTAPAAKEVRTPILVSSAKQAALAVRKAATAVVSSAKATNNNDDQGPSAGAAVTDDVLQPKYV